MHMCVGKSSQFFSWRDRYSFHAGVVNSSSFSQQDVSLAAAERRREAALTFLCLKSVCLPSKVCRLTYYCTFIWSFSWLCTQPRNSLAHKPPCETMNLVKSLFYTSFFSHRCWKDRFCKSIFSYIISSSLLICKYELLWKLFRYHRHQHHLTGTWQQLISNRP